MKKRFFTCIALCITVLLVSFTAVVPQSSAAEIVTDPANTAVNNTPDSQKVLEARFLNMLNHNFVYGDCFNYTEDIVNNSIVALLDLRNTENDSFISQKYVNNYLYDMYGIENVNYSEINNSFPQLDGFVYIIPRGYSIYNHEIASVTQNQDGSYTVTTNITISSHDGESVNCKAVTLFVKNEKSQFGYNIISSDFVDNLSAV